MMGRKRVIRQDAILDAAERVVGRDGAVNLTLDAVATEACVSKASVIYDYKSKQGLIEAVVERAFRADNEHHVRTEAKLESADSTAIRGRILAASEPPPPEFRAVALNLSAALTLNEVLRQKMQANQSAVIERILDDSSSSRGALLAYLALEGLKLLEYLDFHQFEHSERSRIIREINWLVNVSPEETALLEKNDSQPGD